MRAVWLSVVLAVGAVAQPTTEAGDLLRAMTDAVARLDYEAAEARAREALGHFETLSPDQLVTVHSTLGILLYAQNQPVEARRQFEAALSIDRGLRLDSVLVSPKTVEFFDALRAEAGPAEGPATPSEIRYVLLNDPRPAAALRSLAVPGWGQFHKGDRAKGWAFALAAGTAVLGTATATLARDAAREDYLAATTPDEAVARYPAYNRWQRTQAAFRIGAAAVWTAATLDALVSGGPTVPETRLRTRPSGGVSLGLTPTGVRVRARW